MIALEIKIDGEQKAVAGVEGGGLVQANTMLMESEGEPGHVILNVQGMAQGEDGESHMMWLQEHLEVGSQVSIRVVEVESIDQPSPLDLDEIKKQMAME